MDVSKAEQLEYRQDQINRVLRSPQYRIAEWYCANHYHHMPQPPGLSWRLSITVWNAAFHAWRGTIRALHDMAI